MVEFLGWLGFLLFIGTLVPFFLRRMRLRGAAALSFSRYHHSIALASLVVLTLHGFLALTSRRNWGWGAGAHLKCTMLSGVLAWAALAAVVAIALLVSRKKPYAKAHCWVVVLLVLLTISHVF